MQFIVENGVSLVVDQNVIFEKKNISLESYDETTVYAYYVVTRVIDGQTHYVEEVEQSNPPFILNAPVRYKGMVLYTTKGLIKVHEFSCRDKESLQYFINHDVKTWFSSRQYYRNLIGNINKLKLTVTDACFDCEIDLFYHFHRYM